VSDPLDPRNDDVGLCYDSETLFVVGAMLMFLVVVVGIIWAAVS